MKSHAVLYPHVFTVGEFKRWSSEARPGEGVIYHVGQLMYDRQGSDQNANSINFMANEALAQAERSDVHLLQRRVAANHYEYIAVKTNPKNVALILKALRRPSSAREVECGKIRSVARLVRKEHECLLANA